MKLTTQKFRTKTSILPKKYLKSYFKPPTQCQCKMFLAPFSPFQKRARVLLSLSLSFSRRLIQSLRRKRKREREATLKACVHASISLCLSLSSRRLLKRRRRAAEGGRHAYSSGRGEREHFFSPGEKEGPSSSSSFLVPMPILFSSSFLFSPILPPFLHPHHV